MTTITLQEEVAGFGFSLTLRDQNSAVLDLTEATVTLNTESPTGTRASRLMTVSAPSSGVATYSTASTDIGTFGRWLGQVRVYYSASRDYPSEVFEILAKKNIY